MPIELINLKKAEAFGFSSFRVCAYSGCNKYIYIYKVIAQINIFKSDYTLNMERPSMNWSQKL